MARRTAASATNDEQDTTTAAEVVVHRVRNGGRVAEYLADGGRRVRRATADDDELDAGDEDIRPRRGTSAGTPSPASDTTGEQA